MAVEGIGNLVQNLADHLFGQAGQGPAAPVGTRILGTQSVGSPSATEDTFTRSASDNSSQAAAQEAGIFQPGPQAPRAASAEVLPAQPTANLDQNAPQRASAAATPNSPQNPTDPAASAQLQIQIQRLNASLPALGLTNSEIQQIDRIASLIGNFNPAAYTDLVQQFEARSQSGAQQDPASASLGAAAIPGSSAASGAGANGFQAQQVLNAPGAQSASGDQNTATGAIPTDASAPGAQAPAGQFTPSTPNAQNQQGQTPRPPANSATSTQAS